MPRSAGAGWTKRRALLGLTAGLAVSVAAGLAVGMRAADDVQSSDSAPVTMGAPAAVQLPPAAADPLAIDTGHAMAASAGYARMSDCQRLDARFHLGCRRYVMERGRRPRPSD